ncbi:hypothetical protein Esti_004769 [Eimeria stiedai]
MRTIPRTQLYSSTEKAANSICLDSFRCASAFCVSLIGGRRPHAALLPIASDTPCRPSPIGGHPLLAAFAAHFACIIGEISLNSGSASSRFLLLVCPPLESTWGVPPWATTHRLTDSRPGVFCSLVWREEEQLLTPGGYTEAEPHGRSRGAVETKGHLGLSYIFPSSDADQYGSTSIQLHANPVRSQLRAAPRANSTFEQQHQQHQHPQQQHQRRTNHRRLPLLEIEAAFQ